MIFVMCGADNKHSCLTPVLLLLTLYLTATVGEEHYEQRGNINSKS